jgi:hypothetical protein
MIVRNKAAELCMNDKMAEGIILKPKTLDDIFILGCIAMWSSRSLPILWRNNCLHLQDKSKLTTKPARRTRTRTRTRTSWTHCILLCS